MKLALKGVINRNPIHYCYEIINVMGQSPVKNYMHIVFSTKYRQKLIHPVVEAELHAYLGGICKKLESNPLIVGGYTDHIHILCMLSKKIALMKLMEELKWNMTSDMYGINILPFQEFGLNVIILTIFINL